MSGRIVAGMISSKLFRKVMRNEDSLKRLYGVAATQTVGEVYDQWHKIFERNVVCDPKESIENILAHVLKMKEIGDVHNSKQSPLTESQARKVEELCTKRLKRMPIEYVIGEHKFRNLNLKMVPPVFIPWIETEGLVELVVQKSKNSDVKEILELCCGSGAISVAILKEMENVKVTAIDQSEDACQLTRENAIRHGVIDRITIHQSKLNEYNPMNFNMNFDMIVSNPPYIFTSHVDDFHKIHEDFKALDGGKDGMEIMKLVIDVSSKLLTSGKKLFLEINPLHVGKIENYITQNESLQMKFLNSYKDLVNKDRYAEIQKK